MSLYPSMALCIRFCVSVVNVLETLYFLETFHDAVKRITIANAARLFVINHLIYFQLRRKLSTNRRTLRLTLVTTSTSLASSLAFPLRKSRGTTARRQSAPTPGAIAWRRPMRARRWRLPRRRSRTVRSLRWSCRTPPEVTKALSRST